jgi:hypothetical protein
MQEQNRLATFMLDVQKDTPARKTFEAFVDLLNQYGLSQAERNLLMSRDLAKVQAAIQQPLAPPVFIVGWWETK